MKKIIIASIMTPMLMAGGLAPALARDDATTTPSITKSVVDLVCMQAAVEKRDTAIGGATDIYSNAIKTALNTRKDALKAAWGKTDRQERRKAIRQAWKEYRDAVAKARKDFNIGKKSAWNQFYIDRKACSPGAAKDDTVTHNVDSNL